MGDPATVVPTFDELYEQIRALPEGMTGEILEPGVLRTMSRPARRHRKATMGIARGLGAFDENFDGMGWWIEFDAEIRLPLGRLAVPDLYGFRVDRVPDLPEENPLTILPDWCCEVLSPNTDRDDRMVKLPLYAQSGVAWNWLVDPTRRTVEVFETIDGRAALTAVARDDQRVVLPPFGEEFAVGSWWVREAGAAR